MSSTVIAGALTAINAVLTANKKKAEAEQETELVIEREANTQECTCSGLRILFLGGCKCGNF